ncbi:MAG: hypothetical protein HDR97_01455 [Bacteroides sp.]|nr:hypothetical protein [Bacteroides sp.]
MDKTNRKAILECRKFLNEQISQKEDYTVEEAKKIIKEYIKKLYNSIK